MPIGRSGTVAALGTAQTLAWASTYYLPAILAAPMARDLGVSIPTVFAAFSVALVISALVGPKAGSLIDRWGGRPVLMSNPSVTSSSTMFETAWVLRWACREISMRPTGPF